MVTPDDADTEFDAQTLVNAEPSYSIVDAFTRDAVAVVDGPKPISSSSPWPRRGRAAARRYSGDRLHPATDFTIQP